MTCLSDLIRAEGALSVPYLELSSVQLSLTALSLKGYKIFMISRGYVFIILLFCVSLLIPQSSYAGIYRYVDSSGHIHFTNVPTSNNFQFYRNEGDKFKVETLIAHYAQRFELDESLIKAVIKVESNYDPSVVSSKGAQGLMQLMPETAREIGVKNPFDPSDSIYGGSYYLRKMLDSFDRNLDYALAAYNAGPGAVRKYGGIPPFKETQSYVQRVKYYINHYQNSKDTL